LRLVFMIALLAERQAPDEDESTEVYRVVDAAVSCVFVESAAGL